MDKNQLYKRIGILVLIMLYTFTLSSIINTDNQNSYCERHGLMPLHIHGKNTYCYDRVEDIQYEVQGERILKNDCKYNPKEFDYCE